MVYETVYQSMPQWGQNSCGNPIHISDYLKVYHMTNYNSFQDMYVSPASRDVIACKKVHFHQNIQRNLAKSGAVKYRYFLNCL